MSPSVVSSPSVFALAFALAFYSCPDFQARVLLVPVSALAGFALTLSRLPVPSRASAQARGCGTVLVLAVGLFSGGLFRQNPDLADLSPGFGFPAERLVRIEGVCLDDSRLTSKGKTFCPVEVRHVYDDRGNRASAKGRVLLLLDDRLRLFWGKKLEIKGSILRGEEKRWLFIAARGGVREIGGEARFFSLRAAGLLGLGRVIDSLGKPGADLFEALFLGYQDEVPPALKDAFTKAGAIHILALSGMHLALLALFLAILLHPVRNRRVREALIFVILLAYVAFVGPKPSILRAAIMFVVFFGLRLARRNTDVWTVLTLSFSLYGVLRTEDLLSLSFILSYLAMAGLFLFTQAFQIRLRPYLPEPLLASVSVSLAAQLATGPVLALEFGVLYPVGILATLLVSPLMTLYLWLGLVACLAHPVVQFREGFAWAVKILYTSVVKIVDLCAGLPSWQLDSWISQALFWGLTLFGIGFSLLPGRRNPYDKGRE